MRFFCQWTLFSVLTLAAAAAPPPTLDELFAELHIAPADRANLFAGQILSTPITEGSTKELAAGFAMYVPAPTAKLVEFVRNGKLLANDKDVIAFGELREHPRPDDLTGITFTPDQADEEKLLTEVAPGAKFNLATEEIKAFHAQAQAIPVYRELLLQRHAAYRKGGLAAVTPYDRGNGHATQPGAELRGAAQESKLFATHFPELHRALLNFPAQQPDGVIHRFFWINQRIENRPTFILSHRLAWVQPAGALMVESQYYVGHSYNSMQIMVGCLPVNGGTVVFYSNRTYCDQLAGFASPLRHAIGRSQMRDEIIKTFEQVRTAVTKAP